MSSFKSPVRIYVKSPNSTIPKDFHIITTPESNIASVKQQLYTTLTSQPILEDQRLIFQGKLLGDKELIKDVLKKVDMSAPQIFHLVVKSGNTTESQTQTSTNQYRNDYGIPTDSFFRHRFHSSLNEPLQNSTAPLQSILSSSSDNFMTGSHQNTSILRAPFQYQYVLINGLPYLMQMPPPTTPDTGNPISFGSGVMPPIEVQEPNIAPPNPELPEADRVQRDRQLAQSLWLIFRLVFFAYLFGQGASFERTTLISLVCIVIYLYQTGRLRIVRIRINQINPADPPEILPQNPPQHQQQPLNQDQQHPTTQSEQEDQVPQPTSPPQESPRDTSNILKIAIFAFFRSIIPTDRIREFQPEEVENEIF